MARVLHTEARGLEVRVQDGFLSRGVEKAAEDMRSSGGMRLMVVASPQSGQRLDRRPREQAAAARKGINHGCVMFSELQLL